MSYRLFLDDQVERQLDGDWVYALSSAEAIAIVQERGMPAHMALDHDLSDGDTTMVFLHWLVEYGLDRGLPFAFTYFVHSQNPEGAKNIRGLIDAYQRNNPEPFEPRPDPWR